MRHGRGISVVLLVLGVLVTVPQVAEAQSLFDRLRNRAQEATERTVDRVVDRGENAVACVIDDRDCVERARRDGQDVVFTDPDGYAADDPDWYGEELAATADEASGTEVWTNYDFVPGSRVIFSEDFSAERVGNFPGRLEFHGGSVDVVEFHGQRLLRVSGGPAHFSLPLPELLPERFTLEFPVHLTYHGNQRVTVFSGDWPGSLNRLPGSVVEIDRGTGAGVRSWDGQGPTSRARATKVNEQVTPIRVMADGSYIKVFVDEQRVANVPNAEFQRGDRIHFHISGAGVREANPVYIGPIQVAGSDHSLYDRLEADGRVATRGVYFDSGSDRIRPESGGTLAEIGAMLSEHSGLRLRIEGHTDSVGDDNANQRLSEQRAAAVRQHLIGSHGIDAARLEAAGIGQGDPVDTNDTPEGRQNNRRVELVRL